LAELTSQQHQDRWLADLLRGSADAKFPAAIAALSSANRANTKGEHDVARQQADLAANLFRSSGNVAGKLQAQFEFSFAAQIERRSEECRRRAAASLTEADKHSYAWLRIQFNLEESVCSGLMDDLGKAEKTARRAMAQAQEHSYGVLYLRALGFVAGDCFDAGDESNALKLYASGLQNYWAGQYPAMRAFNFYTGLADDPQDASRPALRVALRREAVALIDSDQDLLLRAMAHNSMAEAAIVAGLPDMARQQFAEAGRLFAVAPRTEASRSAVLENEIRTARVEGQQGRFENAIAQLTRIQDQVRSLSNNYDVQMFYSTLGEVQLGVRRNPEAEQALLPALALAEHSLATLHSDAERIGWSTDAAPTYLSLVESQLAQGNAKKALETYEWYLGVPQRLGRNSRVAQSYEFPSVPLSASGASAATPLQLDSRLFLIKKETVLAYAVLPDGLAIWLYDDRGIQARWLARSTEGLRELAERFRDLASDPASESIALRRDAHSLYDALIAPVEQYLEPGRTLAIEGEGWLASIPFEALLDSHNHYLIERASIVHSLGRDSEVWLNGDKVIASDAQALVVGSTATSPGEDLGPLPDVVAEADTVAQRFRSARLLKGGQATLGAVRDALPEAAVFHFAGHSLSASNRTGLLLRGANGQSATEVLDVEQLRHVRLPGLQLAVLSACNTSEGGAGASGFNNVTDALLRTGVPHVVASRWAVDSAQDRIFVLDFYSNLFSGIPVSEATRTASLKMLSNPQTSHPYYWSAFAAYGTR
jgi:CHAT domain-containing protein